jgi:hypothetical protein
VTWDDCDFVGKGEKTLVDGAKEFGRVAAREVGAADGAGEEGVSGQEEMLVRKVEADGAFSVAGGVEDDAGEGLLMSLLGPSDGDEFAVVEGVVGVGDEGSGDA